MLEYKQKFKMYSTENYIPGLRYNWLTVVYNQMVRLARREISYQKALVKQMQIQPFQRILNLACGTGTLSTLIKQNCSQATVAAVDDDMRILELAREKAKKSSVRIEFEPAFSFWLPYANESFDCVVSSLFFHHLTRENKIKTLLEVFRVLKSGGEIHIADYDLPEKFLMKKSSRRIKLLNDLDTTSDNFKGLLPLLFSEAGFKETEETRRINSLSGTIRLLKARK